MIKRLFLLAALTGVWSVSAQNGTLHLRLVDRVTREPVVGAVAELRSQADTARTPFYAASDIDGAALLQRVPAGAWRLRVTSLGYEALERELRTSGGKTDLGTLEMSPGAEAIESVVLEVPALRSSIRGDTLSYRASAYKVTFGADAGALIGKMPGLEVADGVIEAQGRTVQRVFVDGREFFGNDVMSAVRNIPADMVESIDVYNSQGDQSEFTGVDIGDGYTAINIVTQPDKRRGAFGRLFAGYGIPDKYIGGGNINIFDRARRLSVIALVNNVNMQNFSSEDILGTTEQGQANARSGSGNFMVRPLDGVGRGGELQRRVGRKGQDYGQLFLQPGRQPQRKPDRPADLHLFGKAGAVRRRDRCADRKCQPPLQFAFRLQIQQPPFADDAHGVQRAGLPARQRDL